MGKCCPHPPPDPEDDLDWISRPGAARAASLFLFLGIVGCSRDTTMEPTTPNPDPNTNAQPAPAGRVTVALEEDALEFWPFTGSGFDGAEVDPIHLILVGATPVEVREALLGVDGSSRSLPGLAAIPTLREAWTEAIANPQTAFIGGRWTASVVQLELGSYDPLRVHVRLFGGFTRSGVPVTLGAAHLEVLIPGTHEHQVVSWEAARAILVEDLLRSGYADAAGAWRTGPIAPRPAYRSVPRAVHRALSPELAGLASVPAAPDAAVPLPHDGTATVLRFASTPELQPGALERVSELEIDEVAPMPFGGAGEAHVSGRVVLQRVGRVGPRGEYTYEGGFKGTLLVTPITGDRDPVPSGAPMEARVDGSQHGFLHEAVFRLHCGERREIIAGGDLWESVRLTVGSDGQAEFRRETGARQGANDSD